MKRRVVLVWPAHAIQGHGKAVGPEASGCPIGRSRLDTAILFITCTLLLAGCGTGKIQRLHPTTEEWRIREGQAVWRPGKNQPEVSGELVVASRVDGACVFNFSKPPVPLCSGQTTHTNWLIEFPAQRLVFGGRGSPPARFIWLQLERVLAGEPIARDLKVTPLGSGGWRLENVKSGEYVEGFVMQ